MAEHPPRGPDLPVVCPDGSRVHILAIDDLPKLPEAWLNGLSSRKKARTGQGFDGSAQEWFDSLRKGFLPTGYNLEVRKSIKRLDGEGGRHDTMTQMVARLVGWGASGLPVGNAINDLFDAYVAAVGGERDAESEFDRAFEGAISKFGSKK